MTPANLAILRDLVRDVCVADDAGPFAARWGTVQPDPLDSSRLEVACRSDLPFVRLEITPWHANGFGLVDVVLVADEPWPVETFIDAFGPVTAGPPLESGAGRVLSQWSEIGLPASALVQAWLAGPAIESFTIRRDPRTG